MPTPVDEGPPLPAEWSAHWSEEQNRFYYYNSTTQKSVWIRPEPAGAPKSQPSVPENAASNGSSNLVETHESKSVTTSANPTTAKVEQETKPDTNSKLNGESPALSTNEGNNKRLLEETTVESGKVGSQPDAKRARGGGGGEVAAVSRVSSETTIEPKLSLEAACNEFASIDAIMNANTLDLIQTLLSETSKLDDAQQTATQDEHRIDSVASKVVDSLASSYVGYADLSNIVVDWMKAIPASQRRLQMPSASVDSGLDPTEQFLIEHVMSMIMQRFSPKNLSDGITGRDPPEWLTSMLKFKPWRNMLVQLAGQHRDVPLLDFAIKAISEAGYHEEVGKVPNASSFFSVYKSILSEILCQFASSATTTSLYKSLLELKQLSGNSQYTYLFTLDMLSALEPDNTSSQSNPAMSPQYSDTPSAAENLPIGLRFVMRRLKQELLLMSASAKDTTVRDGMELFNPMRRVASAGIGASNGSLSPEVQTIVEQVLENRRFLPEQLSRLRVVFDGLGASPLWILRQHNILAILVGQLFQPYTPISEQMRRDGAYLLAVACAYEGAPATVVAKVNGEPSPGVALEELQNGILRALEVCNSEHTLRPEGLNPRAPGMIAISKLMELHPPISAGVLTWVLACLSSPKFFKGSGYAHGLPTLLHLVRVAARSHPLQRRQAFFLIKSAFESFTKASTIQNKLRRTMLNEMIYLMELGYTVPVLEYVTFLSKSGCDFSLLRHFVAKFVKTAGPPFSAKFCEVSLGLLDSPNCRKAVSSNLHLSRDVVTFRKHCAESMQQQRASQASNSPSHVSSSVTAAAEATSLPTKLDKVATGTSQPQNGIPTASMQMGSAVIRLVPFSSNK